MFACPLFCKFRELNETAKLKGVNIDTVATSIGITHSFIIRLFDMACQNAGHTVHNNTIDNKIMVKYKINWQPN